MPAFPLFVDLKKKKCVLVGGGKTAYRKIQRLLSFEPEIWVISPQCCQEIASLQEENKIKRINTIYDVKYIENAYMIIAATNNKEVNQLIYKDAVERNILINVVDCIEHCTFLFPALVERGDLVLGISSAGAYPALVSTLRGKIERLIPDHYTELVSLLKDARYRIMKEIEDPTLRSELLYQVLDVFLLNSENGNIEFLKSNFNCIIKDIIKSNI